VFSLFFISAAIIYFSPEKRRKRGLEKKRNIKKTTKRKGKRGKERW